MPRSAPVRTLRRGPRALKCRGEDEAPGPPLKMNITGRFALSATPSRVYAVSMTTAAGEPSGPGDEGLQTSSRCTRPSRR